MSAPVWTPLGPGCLIHSQLVGPDGTASGRVTAIAIDPSDPDNTIYVGADGGGIWKTIDGGLHWIPLTDDLETHISCIALDSGRIIAGYTDAPRPEFGLVVLPAGSQTWQRIPSGIFSPIRTILVDPANANHLYAATRSGLFERSDDGQPWTRIVVQDPGEESCEAVMDRSNPAKPILYVAIAGKGLFRRIGTGAFQFVPGAPTFGTLAIMVALCAQHPATLYAACFDSSQGTIAVFGTDNATVDNVADVVWSRQGRVKDDFFAARVMAVAPDNPQTVFVGGVLLWRSADGGKQWELVHGLHVDQHAIAFHPHFDSQTLPTMWLGNDGGVMRSTNGGATWAHRNRGLQTLEFYGADQDPRYETVILAGSQDNGAMRFEGSAAWVYSGGGDVFDVAIDPNHPRTWLWTGLTSPSRSLSAGFPPEQASFDKGMLDSDTHTQFNRKVVIDPGASILYTTGGSRVYVFDGGDTWKPIKTGSGATLADFTANVTAVAVAPGGLYVGADTHFWLLKKQADGTYSQTSGAGPMGTGIISSIAVHPTSPDRIYVIVTVSQIIVDHQNLEWRLFRSDTAGQNWTDVTPTTPDLRQRSMNSVVLDPADPTHIYVGGEQGVFRSVDEGATWQSWSDNLPKVEVRRLMIHDKSRLIRAATFGRGVWERPLSDDDAPDAAIYLRDNALDIARRNPTQEAENPYAPGVMEKVFTGADLKLVLAGPLTPTSTVDYTPGGDLDYIGFHDLASASPVKGRDSKIFLQVNNRGPKTATNVQARLFWANKSGASFPDLPSDFWTQFPSGNPSDTSNWHPVAAAQTIPELRPAEPVVLTFSWPSQDLGDTIGVLAAITSPDDPIQETGLSVASVVPTERRVLLKEMSVIKTGGGTSTGKIVAEVIIAVGLVAAIALAVKK
jgi:photosystem II stability/assembly factor-like uncharacterized protein